MPWFKFLKNTYNPESATPTAEYIKPPMRRKVFIDNLEENIDSGETIYVDLATSFINKYYDTQLDAQDSQDSYIVIYEDSEYEDYGIAVKSKVIDNIIYFSAAEDHSKNTKTSKYYSIYYGLNYLKYIENYLMVDDVYAYKQVDDVENSIFIEGSYLDLGLQNLTTYTYEATQTSSKSFKLSLNDNGFDWIDNTSTKPGAKALGIFDGPGFEIYGAKGPNYGKFKIRIFSLYDDNSISKNLVLDWTIIDCYSPTIQESVVLSYLTDMKYNRYLFELEVISEKNVMSQSNQVKIEKYMFSPNYKLTYEKEELNPDLSFVRIGGIR
jgi:hypothetical protein